jgi:hypothetical protein
VQRFITLTITLLVGSARCADRTPQRGVPTYRYAGTLAWYLSAQFVFA